MASRRDLLIFLELKLSLVKDLCELAELEKKRLLDLASGMDRIILLLLFETGLDLEFLINLRVSDLDIDRGQLRVAENRKIRLSSGALSEIKQFLKSRPGQVHLLEGRCAKPVTSKWKRCVLESLLRKSKQ
jgi:site-specific recombinase XerC